jgi:hypothetical protein
MPEVELEVQGTRDRVESVRGDLDEPALMIETDRLCHIGDSVEAHPLVADPARVGDDPVHQASTDTLTPKLVANEEALHLAGLLVDRAQAHAPGKPTSHEGEGQRSPGRGILPRQVRDLVVEILKIQGESEPVGVLSEHPGGERDRFSTSGHPETDRRTVLHLFR